MQITKATIELDTKELTLLKNWLTSVRAYRNMKIPMGAVVWTKAHESLFDKVIRCYHL